MSTTKQAPSNGTHKQLPETTNTNGSEKNPINSKTFNTEVTLPVVKHVEKKEADEQKPIEDRVIKIQVLIDLVDRRDKLLETQRKLNSFKLSSDGSRDKLTINDSKSSEFLTTNSAVIKDVIETLKISIQKKLEEVEKQIVF